MVKVLIVDDSSVIRKILQKSLSMDSRLQVVGAACDPYEAREMIAKTKPDVLVLDIEMPKMDGISFLEKIMAHHPIRTLIFSSLTQSNSQLALRALEVGAVDVMAKPMISVSEGLQELGKELCQRVYAVAHAKMQQPSKAPQLKKHGPVLTNVEASEKMIGIASSTGGTVALRNLLPYFPSNSPGILVVQHMPPVFTKSFADQLNSICAMEVKEAEPGDRVIRGRVLICPGDFHMEVRRSGAFFQVGLHQQAPLHGVRPAADYLFWSMAKNVGTNAFGIVLTGMGGDGADGLLKMKEAGSYNVAQDEASCVVFGMPKVAIEKDAVHSVQNLDDIYKHLFSHIQLKYAATGYS